MSYGYKAKAAPNTTGSIAKDVALPTDNCDTISSVRWSPTSDHLAAASWDSKVRVYEIAKDGNGRGVAMLTLEGPAFSCDWSKDGTMVTAAGADKKVHILQAATSQTTSFAAHDAPIRDVRFVDVPSAAAPIIASGSWDKTVKYWDIRNTGQALATLQLPERVYAMDTGGRLLAVSTADNKVTLVDLHTNPAVAMRTDAQQLKQQTRGFAVAPSGTQWATGSIEGRAGVASVDQEVAKKANFTWRCHRDAVDAKKQIKIWACNAMAYNPKRESCVATGGADGTFVFWDVENHIKLKAFTNVGGAITACGFDRTGTMFAYAVGYDWSMGYAHNTPSYPTKLMIHPTSDEETYRAK